MNETLIFKKWWFWAVAIFITLLILNVIESNKRPQVKSQLSSSQGKENAKKTSEISEKQKKQELENKLTSDDRHLKEMDIRISAIKTKLGKYYASTDDVQELMRDITVLTITKAAYGTGKSETEKRVHSKAAALLPKAEVTLREAYASSVEEIFMKSGMDAQVRAVGNGKKTLRIKYALMSQPMIYKFQNEIRIDEQAKTMGFSKLIYTNGFESDLGETWTVNLK